MEPKYRCTQTPIVVSKRDEGEGVSAPTVRGHAATFNEWTVLYDSPYSTYREIIRPGAFEAAIAERQDVRFLFNHNRDYVLARTASETLRLSEDAIGLAVNAELLDSQLIRDLILGPARRGDINQMSFAFLPRPGGWKETMRDDNEGTGKLIYESEVTSVDLYDVSIVAVPAYPGSTFDVRSRGHIEASAEQVDFVRRDEKLKQKRKGHEKRRALLLMDASLRLADSF